MSVRWKQKINKHACKDPPIVYDSQNPYQLSDGPPITYLTDFFFWVCKKLPDESFKMKKKLYIKKFLLL